LKKKLDTGIALA